LHGQNTEHFLDYVAVTDIAKTAMHPSLLPKLDRKRLLKGIGVLDTCLATRFSYSQSGILAIAGPRID